MGVLLAAAARCDWNAPQELLPLLKSPQPWVVLGFVADAEQGALIDQRGDRLRREAEMALQKQGAKIYSLSLSERQKWEQLWGLPFTGRLPDKLIDELAKPQHLNVLAGSYPNHSPDSITTLAYDDASGRSYVFHNLPPVVAAPTPAPAPAPSPEERGGEDRGWNHRLLRTLEPSRERPLRTDGRLARASRRRTPEELGRKLAANPVLLKTQEEYRGKTPGEIEKAVEAFAEQGSHSILSSTSLEYFSRAYVLALMIPERGELAARMLEEVAEREEFISEWDRKRAP